MPVVLIEVRRAFTQEQEMAIMEAVHAALVQAFEIPRDDRNIRLLSYQPHRFACPPDKTQPATFTQVTIDAFEGRSIEAKRKLYRAIVQNLEPLGIPKDHVVILLRESPRDNWGIRGGQAACDVDLGFVVEV